MARRRGRGRPQILQDDGTRLPPEEEARLAAEARAYAHSDAEYAFYTEADPEDGDALTPPDLDSALAALESWADPERAARLSRQITPLQLRCLGVPAAGIEDMSALWRSAMDPEPRSELARALWDSAILDARMVAIRLLTQARMRPDATAWDSLCTWVSDCPHTLLGDPLCKAGARRLYAHPERIEELEPWIQDPDPWRRRAALLFTQLFTRDRHPDATICAGRDRVLGWATLLAQDPRPPVQSALLIWLGDLARHDPERLRQWLHAHGEALRNGLRETLEKRLSARGISNQE